MLRADVSAAAPLAQAQRGRGSESALSIYGDLQGRDQRERLRDRFSLSAILQDLAETDDRFASAPSANDGVGVVLGQPIGIREHRAFLRRQHEIFR